MKYTIDNIDYTVVIKRKLQKNTYIRVKGYNEISVTTSFLASNKEVLSLIKRNELAIKKMIKQHVNKEEKKATFYFLGSKYAIIIIPTIDDVYLEEDQVITKDMITLDKWKKQKMIAIFKERYQIIYNMFNENVPLLDLKIRKMKTRWGVCNIKSKTITLNSHLIDYEVEVIDYVIIHELCHLVHFNHSKHFWSLVESYCPNYKKIRKKLKE